ncbi:MAG: cardiolipin synthase [Peptococcaceae bacterium]|nr:cardiolipin synthase [Peptococcaceae bacterium]
MAVKKGRVHQKGLSFVSNSIFLTVVLLLFQIALWAGFYQLVTQTLDDFPAMVVRIVVAVLKVSMIGYIILRCPHNAYQISWLILLVIAPGFALMMYVIIRLVPGTAHLTKQVYDRKINTDLHLVDSEMARRDLAMMDRRYVGLFQYLAADGRYPSYYADDLTYYDNGGAALEAMFADLDQAKSFIFMEYFIVSEGQILDYLLEILKKKIDEGVEVRLMYDGLCGLRLPSGFAERCNDLGIMCCAFSPIRPVISSYQNNRDHRKITVIDGKIAYTGGFNLADEYANLIDRFGHWKDAGVRITGHGVQSLTGMFLQMWGVAADWQTDAYARYMKIDALPVPSKSIIAPYADAPENHRDTAADVYCQILDLAEDYVHIMTPYLILDERLRKSLEFAAERGIDVTLLLPHIPDKKIVFLIARSYYPELLASGIKIYEYTPGFVHSKVFVSDDCVATVGSVNLDFRSLFLHFENSVLAYDKSFARRVEADFDQTLEESERIYLKTYSAFPWYKRAFGRLMRVFGPLM